CVAGNLRTVGKCDVPVGAVYAEVLRFLRRKNLHAEAARLRHRAAPQIAAAQSGWKSQIIFDARAEARLAAWSFALNNHRAQSFRRAVNGRGKPRRPTADDGEVVKIRLCLGVQAQLAGNRRKGWLCQALAVWEEYERQSLCFRP